ncbi:hypothetical protein EDB85DRAFT_1120881 [Lactarius pseudohatsudake]|nr:hypothetical protein EDB85DRAFT_1120881 [Lactarius pseudohatsudake]
MPASRAPCPFLVLQAITVLRLTGQSVILPMLSVQCAVLIMISTVQYHQSLALIRQSLVSSMPPRLGDDDLDEPLQEGLERLTLAFGRE